MKKWIKGFVKGLCWALAAYFVFLVLDYARIAYVNDLSLAPIHHSSLPGSPPVYLISYAGGSDSYLQNQNAMAASALNKGIDFIFNYRKSHIDPVYEKTHEKIFSNPAGQGLWLWKPYFIYETLLKIPENAILIYLDSAFIFHAPIDPLVAELKDKDILLFHAFGKPLYNGHYVTGNTFHLMNCTSKACRQGRQIAGGMMILRNTPQSRSFIKAWKDFCEDPRILEPHQDLRPHYPEFIFSFSDGSVLSLLSFQRPDQVKILEASETYPYLYWTHRRQTPASPIKDLYTLYGARRLSYKDNGKSLTGLSFINFPPFALLRDWVNKAFVWPQKNPVS